jgi:hypothetical protein
MNIIEFLTARLDEDEEAARAAALSDFTAWAVDPDEPRQIRINAPGAPRLGGIIAWTVGRAELPHIARHDPARALADVAAKRAILNRFAEEVAIAADYKRALGYTDSEWTYVMAGRETIYDLAHVYADHADYNPAWEPQRTTWTPPGCADRH